MAPDATLTYQRAQLLPDLGQGVSTRGYSYLYSGPTPPRIRRTYPYALSG
jgi:hypothetical protein